MYDSTKTNRLNKVHRAFDIGFLHAIGFIMILELIV